jgi:hypothetical protein
MPSFSSQQDFDRYLFERFPHLYADMYGSVRGSCMPWGCCVGKGWYPIIEAMSEKLEALILALPEQHRNEVKAVQVKEKFGGLRVYMSYQTEEMSAVIREAEKQCYQTCEQCGQPGKIQKDGWWSVQCRACLLECEVRRLQGHLDKAKTLMQVAGERDCENLDWAAKWDEKPKTCLGIFPKDPCLPCAAKRWLEDVRRDEPEPEEQVQEP